MKIWGGGPIFLLTVLGGMRRGHKSNCLQHFKLCFTFKYILGMVPIDMFFCLSAGGGGDKRSSYIILEHSINNIYIRKFKSPTWIVTKIILNVISSVF